MYKKGILLILLLVNSNFIFGQLDSNTKAKLYFTEAEKLYNQGDFTSSAKYITKAENTLGTTVARILALKIKVYYAKGDFVTAKKLIDNYTANYMDSASEDLNNSVLALYINIEEAAEKTEAKDQAVANAYKHFSRVSCTNYKCKYGKIEKSQYVKCSKCNGKGKIKNTYFKNKDGSYDYYKCHSTFHGGCGGAGKVEKVKVLRCETCNGRSKIYTYKGSYAFTKSEIESYITNNKSKIDNYINSH